MEEECGLQVEEIGKSELNLECDINGVLFCSWFFVGDAVEKLDWFRCC